ncbi:hypothetical protein VPH35_001211 [Triticum aestivum]
MAVQPPNPASPVPLVRAANLGGWLVTEGWILPSLFDGIPNNDLRDDTQLQFRSVTQNAFIAAENGGGAALVANRASAFGWESFKLGRIDTNTFNFKVFNDQFVTIAGVNAVATAAMAGKTEMFQLLRNDVDKNRMRIRAPNGSFLQANKDGSMTANFGESTTWGDDDPSVFVVTIVNWVPSIFDGIPNKDLLDGTQLQFKSVTQNAFVAAENGGGAALVANRPSASGWESFKLWRINHNTFNFKVSNNQFVTVSGVNVVATASAPGQTETFQLVRSYGDKNRMRIRASNGSFLQANKDGSVTANFGESTTWGDNDPSVFAVNIVNGPQGEYQICNGYGKDMATQVMNNHWSTYIVETDFAFMAANSLNAVRIPVGWWIASDPNPPAPFVGGSLQALDIAFTWAERHNIHVIIDLHAAPGSQNPDAHSGGRDGSQTWGDSQIVQTVQVIDFLAASFTVQDNIDYFNNFIASEINAINRPDGPLTFVGEWVAEWQVKDATKEDFQRFANAQMAVYRKATFGWAYWTYKNVNNHWSMQWMMDPYISLGNA